MAASALVLVAAPLPRNECHERNPRTRCGAHGHRESTASPFKPGGRLERHAFVGSTARGVYETDQGSNILPDSHPDAGGAHVWQDRRAVDGVAGGVGHSQGRHAAAYGRRLGGSRSRWNDWLVHRGALLMRGSPAPESAGHELMIAGAVLSVVPLLLLFLVLKRC
jgi:hypothetical protein